MVPPRFWTPSESAQYREAAEKAEKECERLSNMQVIAESKDRSIMQQAEEIDGLQAECERLRVFIGGLAEGDCYYGDGCPMGARHGKCTWCQARAALAAGAVPR